jgi:hypothetical protein
MISKQQILEKLQLVLDAYKEGRLSAETMPEDSRPKLEFDSFENLHYFTLPMSLNYQRNSYSLWNSAKKAFEDKQTNYLFFPEQVVKKSFTEVQSDLLKYKVALQPNKHTTTWIKLSETFVNSYSGNIKNLFVQQEWDLGKIKNELQVTQKKLFPYLSGHKIANYWLYVLTQYTTFPFTNLAALTVAPDTHVIQASIKLGLIDDVLDPLEVSKLWEHVLVNTNLVPISIHTPLWLWSRNNFQIGLHKTTLL